VAVKLFYQLGWETPLLITILYLLGQTLSLIVYWLASTLHKNDNEADRNEDENEDENEDDKLVGSNHKLSKLSTASMSSDSSSEEDALQRTMHRSSFRALSSSVTATATATAATTNRPTRQSSVSWVSSFMMQDLDDNDATNTAPAPKERSQRRRRRQGSIVSILANVEQRASLNAYQLVDDDEAIKKTCDDDDDDGDEEQAVVERNRNVTFSQIGLEAEDETTIKQEIMVEQNTIGSSSSTSTPPITRNPRSTDSR
jgi:hypothetical protein